MGKGLNQRGVFTAIRNPYGAPLSRPALHTGVQTCRFPAGSGLQLPVRQLQDPLILQPITYRFLWQHDSQNG